MSTIYWAPMPEHNTGLSEMSYRAPSRVLEDLNLDLFKNSGITKCPSFTNHLKNTFVIKSPLDIQLRNNDDTHQWEWSHPSEIVMVRDPHCKLFTLRVSYLFFTEDEDVKMEVRPCFYHLSEFIAKTALIGGDIHIPSFARATECAFILKPEYNNLKIHFNDPLFYVNFITKGSKVKLKKFDCTHEIRHIAAQTSAIKNSRSIASWPIEKYYSIFNQSGQGKKLLKLIKENLLD